METYEFIFRVIETALQLVLVIFAGLALSVWKREVRGKDKYKLARELLTYIKELRFLIHSKNGSFHQIYLNDILVNRENFYNDQLILIGKDEPYGNNPQGNLCFFGMARKAKGGCQKNPRRSGYPRLETQAMMRCLKKQPFQLKRRK